MYAYDDNDNELHATIRALHGQLGVARARVDEMIRLNDEQQALYETVLAQRDEARRQLDELRSQIGGGS